MHSFDWVGKTWLEQGRGEVEVLMTFFHHGDYSGNVKVILPNKIADVSVAHGAGPNGEGMAEVYIPFAALKALVLNYMRTEIVGTVEDATDEALELVLRGATECTERAKR